MAAKRSRDLTDRLLDAALDLAVSRGWARVALADVATEAGTKLSDAYAVFPSKPAVLAGLLARADRQVLADGPADDGDTPRDRLFEVLMRRFDALSPYRSGIAAIVRDLPTDPPILLCVAPRLLRSMAWMLEAAGISTAGPAGVVRIQAMAVLYLGVLRVWLDDDSEDMARTMAALDRALRRAETLARWLEGGLRPLNRGESNHGDSPATEAPSTAGGNGAP